jgi:hypothetical protein
MGGAPEGSDQIEQKTISNRENFLHKAMHSDGIIQII